MRFTYFVILILLYITQPVFRIRIRTGLYWVSASGIVSRLLFRIRNPDPVPGQAKNGPLKWRKILFYFFSWIFLYFVHQKPGSESWFNEHGSETLNRIVVITPHNNIISLNFVCDQVKWENMTGSSTNACAQFSGNNCAIQNKPFLLKLIQLFCIPVLNYKLKADIQDAKKFKYRLVSNKWIVLSATAKTTLKWDWCAFLEQVRALAPRPSYV